MAPSTFITAYEWLDNDSVQTLVQDAINTLENAPVSSDEVVNFKNLMVLNYLKVFKAYASSGNSIPALGSIGLEEGILVAKNIVAGNQVNLNFKNIGLGINFK